MDGSGIGEVQKKKIQLSLRRSERGCLTCCRHLAGRSTIPANTDPSWRYDLFAGKMPAARSPAQAFVRFEVALDGGVDFAVQTPINHDQTARAHQQLFKCFERLVEDGLQS